MLRVDSKKARENVRRYIITHSELSRMAEDFEELSYNILYQATEEIEGGVHGADIDYDLFEYWSRSLPEALDCSYHIDRAIYDLANILEASEEERLKYKEKVSERILTRVIYRELCEGCDAYIFGI